MNETTATPTKREEFLTDILVTAVEGGIGYWSQAGNYRHSGPVEGRGVTLYIYDVYESEVKLDVINDEDLIDPDQVVVRVTLADIEEGIRRILYEDDFKASGQLLVAVLEPSVNNDAGEIDADTADIIVQAAVFGEIMFG
jgi:hypothetical protein